MWNTKYLSHSGKIVLLKSVCTPMLDFYMQSLPFPKSSCLEIDKLFRNFLWNSFQGNKKINLVSWDTVTLPVEKGGLGLFKSYQRNQAFLGKLCWRMHHESSSVWANICIQRLIMSSKSSVLLKSLKRGRDVFNLGVKHVIHSGLQTSLWHDVWLSQGSLRSLISGPLLSHESNLKVADAFSVAGNWEWRNFSFVFPQSIYNALISSPRSPFSNTRDSLAWGPSSNGRYTISSACNILSKQNPCPNSNLKWIWRLTCHNRIKFFVWLICHNSLPTNLTLANRGISVYPYCVLCGQHDEGIDHLFKFCSTALLVWDICVPFPNFQVTDFYSWFKSCAMCQEPSYLNIPFGTIFVYCVWSIWLARNYKIFHNAPIYPIAIAETAKRRATEFFHLGINHSNNQLIKNPVFISWKPPDMGWIKINVDGACDSNSNAIAAGVLLGIIWVIGSLVSTSF